MSSRILQFCFFQFFGEKILLLARYFAKKTHSGHDDKDSSSLHAVVRALKREAESWGFCIILKRNHHFEET